jgi:hypothetical protein
MNMYIITIKHEIRYYICIIVLCCFKTVYINGLKERKLSFYFIKCIGKVDGTKSGNIVAFKILIKKIEIMKTKRTHRTETNTLDGKKNSFSLHGHRYKL